MSGRIRSIKPELLEDAVTAGLTDMAFRLFIACILLADDYGNLRFEPAWLKGQVYWAREASSDQFSSAVDELTALVTPYVVKGQRYGSIKNWTKHQKVSHPGKPRVPGLAESLPRVSGGPPETLGPDLRSPITDPDPSTDRRPPAEEPSSGPRFTRGTTSFAARERYTAAITGATKKPFVLGRETRHDIALCDLLNAYSPDGDLETAFVWLDRTVTAWVAAVEARYSAGYAPAKLLDWLNADRPSRLSSTGTDGPRRIEPDMTNHPSRRIIRDEDLT